MMQISENGLRMIEGFEGCVLHPYQDSVGVWTIGFGHTAGVGPNSPNLTMPQAEGLLRNDVDSEYGAAVNALGLPLNQNQFDALTSFVYNLGPGVLSGSLLEMLRAHEWSAVAEAMLGYDHAGGVVLAGLAMRRQRESELFLTPAGPPPPPPPPPGPNLSILTMQEREGYIALKGLSKLRHPRRWRVAHKRVVVLGTIIYNCAQHGVGPGGAKIEPGWSIENRRARYEILRSIL